MLYIHCTPCRRIHPLVLILAAALTAALGCREDAESPTEPEAAPVLATTATAALAFYQVSAGSFEHTCGVTTDNRASCWGLNSEGQLGDGTTTQRVRPVAVAGTLRFQQISASFGSTCGVTTDYKAYCWGDNPRGELGDGTTIRRITPVPVAGGPRFRQVDANFEHACAVTYPDNRVYCWGTNSEGELGDGTRVQSRLRPVPVAGALAFREVSAGYHHTCGVTSDNRVFCWGSNAFGQLGDSSSVSRRLKPSLVAGNRQFRQVDASREHTCAVTTDQRAFCWGNGRQGQVGNGKAYLSFWPKAVAGGLRFERVTTGAFHSCGETTLNRAYCWGNNGNSQLGDGTTTNRLTPVAVAGNFYFAQVSAGGFHSCARTSTAVAYCWGNGFEGQLGNGSTSTSSTPVRVSGG